MKLKDLLKNTLSEKELEIAPSGFDMIGDLAIIKLNEELEGKEKVIAEQLLKLKQVKTVLKKEGKVDNEFRVRKYKVIGGENTKETLHIEFGCRYKLNIETAYFSPRLGNERERITNQIKDKEKILVMFAGIGPYAIQIAKYKDADIWGVEINPEGIKYFRENAKLNKVEKKIKIFEGDVRKIVSEWDEKFDRIIMPLPKDAETFLDVAKKVSGKNTIIHLYMFADSKEEAIEKINYDIEVLDCIECGGFSKTTSRYCIDFRFK